MQTEPFLKTVVFIWPQMNALVGSSNLKVIAGWREERCSHSSGMVHPKIVKGNSIARSGAGIKRGAPHAYSIAQREVRERRERSLVVSERIFL